ncbi:hypothetical protein [Permianibacter aggregans]|uniref:hypothetical protein n=1 Tax=Permianibacter aggregans TaxID=1510150 RepID=UPI00105CE2DF|nr:hypothetical protein [Permianibacter aggregans]QGX38600.1 hypothetical protein E2H98_02560 [Permianibacter aggregans]
MMTLVKGHEPDHHAVRIAGQGAAVWALQTLPSCWQQVRKPRQIRFYRGVPEARWGDFANLQPGWYTGCVVTRTPQPKKTRCHFRAIYGMIVGVMT